MALINQITQDEVTGIRFGKYNLADNSTVLMYLLGSTLIDSGPPNQWKEVKTYLSEKTFNKLLLTHHHEDHSGNSARIASFFQVPVYIHNKGVTSIENGFPLKMYQKIFWGKPKPFTPQTLPEPPTPKTPNQKAIDAGGGFELLPIHTPGHSPDHVCFLEPNRKWLFTGDLFLAMRPKLFREDEDLAGEIQSLKAIMSYDFDTLFCAHKGVVKDGKTALKKKLSYFLEIVDKVKDFSLKGASAKEITHRLFGKTDTAGIISFKHICYENLVLECLKINSTQTES